MRIVNSAVFQGCQLKRNTTVDMRQGAWLDMQWEGCSVSNLLPLPLSLHPVCSKCNFDVNPSMISQHHPAAKTLHISRNEIKHHPTETRLLTLFHTLGYNYKCKGC